MELRELDTPTISANPERIFDCSVSPADRLRIMSSREFEDITALWLKESINIRYSNVAINGGSKDAGRDIIAYRAEDPHSFDIYQCKHYREPLKPSIYWVEFGKLCYYTFIKRYDLPKKYYIVASNGIGDELRFLVEHPSQIGPNLLSNWDRYCAKKKQITAGGIPLTKELNDYISDFDFTIVQEITPMRLLHEIENTKWYKYYFGGGLKKRTIVVAPSDNVTEKEESLPYISQLIKVYSMTTLIAINNVATLRQYPTWIKHLQQQRHCFYSAQQLARFARDELLEDSAYTSIKTEVQYAVTSALRQDYSKPIDRVDRVLADARSLNINNPVLRTVNSLDSCGICHELVNDGEMEWYEESESGAAI